MPALNEYGGACRTKEFSVLTEIIHASWAVSDGRIVLANGTEPGKEKWGSLQIKTAQKIAGKTTSGNGLMKSVT